MGSVQIKKPVLQNEVTYRDYILFNKETYLKTK